MPLVAALVLSLPADPARDLLAASRSAYEALKSARMVVRFQTTDGTSEALQGVAEILYLAPRQVKVTVLPKSGKAVSVLVSEGKLRVTRAKGKVSTVPYSFKALERSLPLSVETLCLLDPGRELGGEAMAGSALFLAASEEWKGKSYTVLEETNKAEDVFDRYYFDPATKLLWRVDDFSSATHKLLMRTEVESLETNLQLDPLQFKIR